MLSEFVGKVIERVTSALPPLIAARIDLCRPSLATGFGEFNGQMRRQDILESVLHAFPFDLVIETGTYRGTTTARLREMTTAPIVTIEVSKRNHEYARRRLAGLQGIRIVHGDSPAEIRRIAASPLHDRTTKVFAYLDAHWGRSLPTRYEILELLSAWDGVCAVIDDFKLPSDPGYAYDDYGLGMVVDQTMLSGLPLAGSSLFFPSVLSSEETGHRRGWAILGKGQQLVETLSRTNGLVLADQWISSAASVAGQGD